MGVSCMSAAYTEFFIGKIPICSYHFLLRLEDIQSFSVVVFRYTKIVLICAHKAFWYRFDQLSFSFPYSMSMWVEGTLVSKGHIQLATSRIFLRHWDHISLSLLSSSFLTVCNFFKRSWKSDVICKSPYWLKVLKTLDFLRHISHMGIPSTHFIQALVLVCFKIYYFIISSEFKEAEWEKITI